ncbi:NAD-dependent epimerase/dehydratase family protein [Emcibacter sp. SYSU 3D8]|uniref:NAD-dependent epimerase/dehydratase family protein n=1 Tax=Emcibacter sp. SYSU 3D8 TaxID=3133969 RepID=UPI0031FE6490
MSVLVTGAAGFIGYHVCKTLLARGEQVIGIDNVNSYYSTTLKESRVAELKPHRGFTFIRQDFANLDGMRAAVGGSGIDRIVHLGAQPGVRYSIDHPMAYAAANLTGHLAVLELARGIKSLRHLVYASSSSVYGGNTKLPFSETDPVEHPVSLYAATKRADELMSDTYAHLYGIPQTGLRFFTVYGPSGRPDMAVWLFTEALFEGRPIRLFENGSLQRDFTYVDDIVAGVLAVLDGPPSGERPHRLYNIGNNKPERVTRLVEIIEQATGRKAEIISEPMQPGDVPATYADITAIRRDHGFEPTTPLEQGVPKFVDWYRNWRGQRA